MTSPCPLSSLCAPTYQWGGLLATKAEEAKKRYRAIRSNVGEVLPDSDKVPSGKLDLQFLTFWIKKNAWDITTRLDFQVDINLMICFFQTGMV